LKLASFFIHVEKGRRRTGRSVRSGIVVSWQSILGMSNGWLDAAELRSKSTLVGDLNEKRERLPHERIPCTCGAVSVVAIVRARCCEVFGGGSYGHGDAADVEGTRRCNRRWKEKARAGDVVWCLSNKEGKRRKKAGKIVSSESASAELEAIDLFYLRSKAPTPTPASSLAPTPTPEWTDHVTCDMPWIASPNRSTSTIKQPISRSYVAPELFIRTASSISMSWAATQD
jgi:hypothetical protein